ncbi:MAG: phosphate ABC transporter permease subunit PstC [Armatimonadetes bacterium]|nr:phosphate ABC transporter permease subunit PstC [Armatimonadota bacterium]
MNRPKEALVEGIIATSGAASILFVILILIFLLRDALPLFEITSLEGFLTGRDWYPTSDPPKFGALPLIVGSLLVTVGAIALAVPIGVAAAVYIAELSPARVREWLKVTVELIAAIPSVVIGFIGLVIVAPWIKELFNLPTGLTALTGAVMLAWMAMPTIVSIAEDAIRSVPIEYRQGSLALGTTHLQTVRHVILPAARSGLIAAIMLGIGRAIGETMTVLMVTGGAAQITTSLLKPVRTMTATIAAEMGETPQGSPHYHALFAVGALLFLITFFINLAADLALRKGQRAQ